MTFVSRAGAGRVGRRAVIAGSAVGAAALALAGTATWRHRASSVPAVDDASLAGPLGDIWVGSPQAKVTLIEYAAVTCTHCAAFRRDTWPVIKTRWIDSGKARFALRGFPLNPFDTVGFMLARSGGGQRYYAITDLLFERQTSWAFVPKPLDAMRDLMRQAGFSQETFDAILGDQALYDGVNLVRAQAQKILGVHATPTLYVNSEQHEGALSGEALSDIIREELDERPS